MKDSNSMRIGLGVLLAVLLAVPFIASAAIVRTGNEVNIPSGQTITDDVYATAGSVVSGARIEGDFVVAGGNIFVTGEITQDITAAGGTVGISGRTGDDLRAAGGNLSISGEVADDAFIAGGQVNMVTGTRIGGDAYVAGGRIVMGSDVGGLLSVRGGQVIISGTVNGDVEIWADSIVFESSAVIQGDVRYAAPQAPEIREGAQINGEVSRTGGADDAAQSTLAATIWWAIAGLFMLFVTALVLQTLFGRGARILVEETAAHPWRNLGLGFVALVVVPIALIVSAVTVVGIPLAVMGLFTYILFLFFSYFFVPVILGSVAFSYYRKSETYIINWRSALIGAVIVAVLGLIPVIGWLVAFLTMLAVLGTLMMRAYARFSTRQDRAEEGVR